MYSARLISIVRAPVSRLALRTASAISPSVTSAASIACGSTSTWYSRTCPPTLATSATPGTAWSA